MALQVYMAKYSSLADCLTEQSISHTHCCAGDSGILTRSDLFGLGVKWSEQIVLLSWSLYFLCKHLRLNLNGKFTSNATFATKWELSIRIHIRNRSPSAHTTLYRWHTSYDVYARGPTPYDVMWHRSDRMLTVHTWLKLLCDSVRWVSDILSEHFTRATWNCTIGTV